MIVVVFLFSLVLVFRLFTLQVIEHPFYAAMAEGQHEFYENLIPERGEIFIHSHRLSTELFPIAMNRTLYLLYANPKNVKQAQKVVETLASQLELKEDKATLLERLTRDPSDQYEPIAHNLTRSQKEQIEKLKLPGIAFTEEMNRYYPMGSTNAHITGFVGYQENVKKGLYGLEGYFEEELAGLPGYLRRERDALGRWIPIGNKFLEEARDGDDYILTIDDAIQTYTCQALAEGMEKYGAKNGLVLIMDPKTGAMLALCHQPTYDPNEYQKVDDLGVFNNLAVSQEYEPGSVMKGMTMAAGLDLGVISPSTTYVDTGEVKIGTYTIHNSDLKAHGTTDMTTVLVRSLNTGAIFVAKQIGNRRFADYIERFGFGVPTGIELSYEQGGDVGYLKEEKDIYTYTASYGQGITVTPIQLLAAYGALANGGTLMKPYLVEKVVKRDGLEIPTKPQVVRQVVTKRTAATLSAMLANVGSRGHAKVEGYYMAGKTGTAQVARSDGRGYDEWKTIHTFAGYGPIQDPKFVVVVKFDQATSSRWADGTTSPLFAKIAKFLVDYYHIPPSVTEE
jgi:cell division protein FtsI/penicillin-binding protein 2